MILLCLFLFALTAFLLEYVSSGEGGEIDGAALLTALRERKREEEKRKIIDFLRGKKKERG